MKTVKITLIIIAVAIAMCFAGCSNHAGNGQNPALNRITDISLLKSGLCEFTYWTNQANTSGNIDIKIVDGCSLFRIGDSIIIIKR